MAKPIPPPKSFFTKHRWLHKAYPGYPLLISLQALAASTEMQKRHAFLKDWGGGLYIEGLLWDWVWDVTGLEGARTYLLQSDISVMQKLFDDHGVAYQKLWDKTNELEGIDFAALTPKVRLHHAQELVDRMLDQASIGYLADCSLSTGANDWLADIITAECKEKNFSDTEVLNAITLLTRPVFVSHQVLAHESLAAIAAAPKARRGALIEKYIKQFHWVNNNYEVVGRPTAAYIRSLVIATASAARGGKQSQSEIATSRTPRNDAAKEKISFYKTHSTSPATQSAIRIAELLSEMQDKRKACVLKTNPLLWSMSEVVASEYGIDHPLFMRLSALEFLDVLDGKKPDIAELKRRAQRALYWYPKEDEVIWSGPELKKFSWDWTLDLADKTELRGVTACAGKATGTARVILTTQNLRDFKKGEIMVSNQTTPEYTPYMRKAAAIVTDQGGLTAHAAVFSREFNIPCVIGTANATKWIKTGEQIAVDAAKGIVQKIG